MLPVLNSILNNNELQRWHIPAVRGLLFNHCSRLFDSARHLRLVNFSAHNNFCRLYHDDCWQHRGDTPLLNGPASGIFDPELTDLTEPATWYPAARSIRRQITAHIGPTNSGKTYQALQALKAAEEGVYCGPLRLLAWEVAEKLNSDGIRCNLITGQEKKVVEGAQHTSCTVEMANVHRPLQVGIVDEVQLMADECRGWAFTRALLGLPVRHLHLCGDPSVLPLLQHVAGECGDKLEVRTYERLAPLRAARRALKSLTSAAPGDCLVAFARKDVHRIRASIDAGGRQRCCMVYGALPPESRQQQATLFNSARTGYNVLAASDAVGMGLNLNIRRIVFTRLTKFDGRVERPLSVTEVKQIAGRAGRFGGRYGLGVVTCMSPGDLPYLHFALSKPGHLIERACILPRFEQLAHFASQRPEQDFHGAIRAFASSALVAAHYFFGNVQAMLAISLMLRPLPLSLREHYLFAISPCDPADVPVMGALLQYASAFAAGLEVPPQLAEHPPMVPARSQRELLQLEATHRIYDLYCWLALRLAPAFTGLEVAQARRERCGVLIEEGLAMLPGGRPTRALQKRMEAIRHSLTGATNQPLKPVSQQAVRGLSVQGLDEEQVTLKHLSEAVRPHPALHQARAQHFPRSLYKICRGL